MGSEPVSCGPCGIRIPSSEFERGRAATVLGRNYCPACAQEVVSRGRDEVVMKGRIAVLARDSETRRIPLAAAPAPLPDPRIALILAGAASALALCLLVYALVARGSGG